MSSPLPLPPKRNPQRKAKPSLAPPAARTRLGIRLSALASTGQLKLQFCKSCLEFAYPPREACPRCLIDDLEWSPISGLGEVIATTAIRATPNLYFRDRVPWRIGTVLLDEGPIVIAHLHGCCATGDRVRARLQLDKSGQAVFFALPEIENEFMNDDAQLREMTNDPKHRRVLITDARTPMGAALAAALADAGCRSIFAGVAELWRRDALLDDLSSFPKVELVRLDLTDTDSVRECAGEFGGKVDILINTAEYLRPGGFIDRRGLAAAKDEFETNVFGFMRLAQFFGPPMRARGSDGIDSASAWVNSLSVRSLSSWPEFGCNSACHAALLSMSQCLRGEFAGSGVRVVNVFSGPLETEWHDTLPPPKVAPSRLARELIAGLQRGLEDIVVGDVAKDIMSRWRDNPKVLERELAAGGGIDG
ncbi:MAG: SDR family oxidoreductase [Albidovulum sp.]|nr:SDR family oxidoreductase [Albidovulum sp.]MDE0532015.1 SDR family oxidoreductase [Albidovulum sp.]